MTAPTLKDRITEDMKAAMRAREADRLGAIRMLLAGLLMDSFLPDFPGKM